MCPCFFPPRRTLLTHPPFPTLVRTHTHTRTQVASQGEFTYALYDLVSDPYEKVNLYHADDDAVRAAKTELYGAVDALNKRAQRDDIRSYKSQFTATEVWKENSNYILPYLSVDADYYVGTAFSSSFPALCEPLNTVY